MCLLLRVCVIIQLVPLIQAPSTPTNTITSTSDRAQASGPLWAQRTLWSIASSCALTIFACIYNAIHPNIPGPKDSHLRILRRRLGIATTLIAPELIVAWAIRQWLSARSVTAQYKEYFSDLPPQGCFENNEPAEALAEQHEDQVNPQAPVAHAEDYAWTLTHSFFVLMGGFMLYVDGEPYHTLQPDQLLRLMRGGFIDPLTITVDQINDKSKRNVSNGIAVYQAILILTSRVLNHLDVTLLEWGTLVFAVFN